MRFVGWRHQQLGAELLAQDPPLVVFQGTCCGLYGGCDLLGLVGEGADVEFEGWLDQCDELCGWCQHPPVDLADGLCDG